MRFPGGKPQTLRRKALLVPTQTRQNKTPGAQASGVFYGITKMLLAWDLTRVLVLVGIWQADRSNIAKQLLKQAKLAAKCFGFSR